MNNQEIVLKLINEFFYKRPQKTHHETLGTYEKNILIPGGENGLFYTHINYYTIMNSLLELIKINKDYYIFVETGCSAHGTRSTQLWDKFVNLFDGKVISVDLNNDAVNLTNNLTSNKTNVICNDSLNILPTLNEKIDFLYLDSYDVNFLKPEDSANHHLKEFNLVKHLLHKDSIVLIDDTPCNPEWLDNGKYSPIYSEYKKTFNDKMCGKGSLVNIELEKMGATKIMHQYQVLWKI